MPLPDLIEIVPLAKPVRAEITVPGSKSITNRALILAALAEGETTLFGALWSEDTEIMVNALGKLGFEISHRKGPGDRCNQTIVIKGSGGRIPNAGTVEKPTELDVGNAGTAARFLTALVCLGHGVYRLSGVPRMHERPQAALFQALRELGYRIDSSTDQLPAIVHGAGPKPGASCGVSIKESSQFASALELCKSVGGWRVEIKGENREEMSYVEMTRNLVRAFSKARGSFQVEPDASSASYFWAKGWLFPTPLLPLLDGTASLSRYEGMAVMSRYNNPIEFEKTWKNALTFSIFFQDWPSSHWQIDEKFPQFLWPPRDFPTTISRTTDLGDSIMTAIVLAPFASKSCRFTDLGRLRLQETERVDALRTELIKCGAKVVEEGDTLTVFPSKLHGAEIETYNDHRMAMCFAILGLKVPGIKIKNPACVKKTFPNFFQKLATPPPHGLGAEIQDANTGRKLEVSELFAD